MVENGADLERRGAGVEEERLRAVSDGLELEQTKTEWLQLMQQNLKKKANRKQENVKRKHPRIHFQSIPHRCDAKKKGKRKTKVEKVNLKTELVGWLGSTSWRLAGKRMDLCTDVFFFPSSNNLKFHRKLQQTMVFQPSSRSSANIFQSISLF